MSDVAIPHKELKQILHGHLLDIIIATKCIIFRNPNETIGKNGKVACHGQVEGVINLDPAPPPNEVSWNMNNNFLH